MNNVFKLISNRRTGKLVVASEHATGAKKGKTRGSVVAASSLLALSLLGGVVLAETYEVDSAGDWEAPLEKSLAEALQNARSGDTIQFTDNINMADAENWDESDSGNYIYIQPSTPSDLTFNLGNNNFSGGNLALITDSGSAIYRNGEFNSSNLRIGYYGISNITFDEMKVNATNIRVGLSSDPGILTLNKTELTASTLQVSGNGSQVTATDNSKLTLTGKLTVSSGGQLDLENSAELTAKNLEVTGNGSQVTAADDSALTFSDEVTVKSRGQLDLENSAELTAKNLEVTGNGSQVTAADDSTLTLGQLTVNDLATFGGGGTLDFTNGIDILIETGGLANLTDLMGNIILGADDKIEVSGVNGEQSTLKVNGLTVNEGELSVKDGGKLEGNSLTIGENANGIVKVNGLGEGEQATIDLDDGELIVGNNNDGSLEITQAGVLETTGAAVVGKETGSTGTILVEKSMGASGADLYATLKTGDITLGESGEAFLTINKGGHVETGSAILAQDDGSTAEVTLFGGNRDTTRWTVGGDTDPGYAKGEGSLHVDGGMVRVNKDGFLSLGTQINVPNFNNVTFTGGNSELNLQGTVDENINIDIFDSDSSYGTFRNINNDGSDGPGTNGNILFDNGAYLSGTGKVESGHQIKFDGAVIAPGSRWMYDFEFGDDKEDKLTSLGELHLFDSDTENTVFNDTTFRIELDRGDNTIENPDGLTDHVVVHGDADFHENYKINFSRVLDGDYKNVAKTEGGTFDGHDEFDVFESANQDRFSLNGKSLVGNKRIAGSTGQLYTYNDGDDAVHLKIESSTQGNVLTHWTGNTGTTTWDMVAENFDAYTGNKIGNDFVQLNKMNGANVNPNDFVEEGTSGSKQFLDGDIVIFDDKWMEDNVADHKDKREILITNDKDNYQGDLASVPNVAVAEVRVYGDEDGTGDPIFTWGSADTTNQSSGIRAYDSSLYTTLDRSDPNKRNDYTPSGQLVKIGTGTLEIYNHNEFYGGTHLGYSSAMGNEGGTGMGGSDYYNELYNQGKDDVTGGIIEVNHEKALGTYDSKSGHQKKGMVFVHEDSTIKFNGDLTIQNRFSVDKEKTLTILFDTLTIAGNDARFDTIGNNEHGSQNSHNSFNDGKGGGIYFGEKSSIVYQGDSLLTVTENLAKQGGGVYAESNSALDALAKIHKNYAIGDGGGVYVAGNGTEFKLHGGAEVTNNYSGGIGGGAYVASGAALILETEKAGNRKGGDIWFENNWQGVTLNSNDINAVDTGGGDRNAFHLASNATIEINGPYNTYIYDPITGAGSSRVVITGVKGDDDTMEAGHGTGEAQYGTAIFKGNSTEFRGSTAVIDNATFRLEGNSTYGRQNANSGQFVTEKSSSLTGQGTINTGSDGFTLGGIIDLDTGIFTRPGEGSDDISQRNGSGALVDGEGGQSQGTLTLRATNGGVAFADSANWKLNLTNNDGEPDKGESDFINVIGNTTFNGAAEKGKKLTLDVDQIQPGHYELLTASGGITNYNTNKRESDAEVYLNQAFTDVDNPSPILGINLAQFGPLDKDTSSKYLGRVKAVTYVEGNSLYLDFTGRNRHVTGSSDGDWGYDSKWTFNDDLNPIDTGSSAGLWKRYIDGDKGPDTEVYLDGDIVTLTKGTYTLTSRVKPADLIVDTDDGDEVTIQGDDTDLGITTIAQHDPKYESTLYSQTALAGNSDLANDYSIIGYTSRLVKKGTGKLTFTNTGGNTFTEGIVLWDGATHYNRADQLGDGGRGILFADNATLYADDDITTGNNNELENNINIEGGVTATFGVAGSKEAVVRGKITELDAGNSSHIHKIGEGTLVLGAENNYSGETIIFEGILKNAANWALGGQTTSLLGIHDGTTYDLDGHTDSAGRVEAQSNSTFRLGAGGDFTIKNTTGDSYIFGQVTDGDAASKLTLNQGALIAGAPDGNSVYNYSVPQDSPTTITVGTLVIGAGLGTGAEFYGYGQVNGNVENNGAFYVGPSSKVKHDNWNDYTVNGDFTSGAGTSIHLENSSGTQTLNNTFGNTLTIRGNYSAEDGANLYMNTLWEFPGDMQGSNTKSDLLVIEKDATGETQVIPITKGQENFIDGSVIRIDKEQRTVPVVIVKDNADEDTFIGAASTGGAGETHLISEISGQGERHFYWYLPFDPNYGPDSKLLASSSSGFTQMSGINRELGLNQLGKLHDRMGEQQTYVWDCCGSYGDFYRSQKELGITYNPMWIRGGLGELKEQGRIRFGHKTQQAFIQIGRDLRFNIDENKNHHHFGVMASYTHARSDFYDKYRRVKGIISDNKQVGKGETDMFSLGAYSTWYRANGAYLDLVGQVSYIRNKYKGADDIFVKSQSGYGLGLSAEVGRPFKLGNSQWFLEPQAQLAYQYVHLDSINAKNTIGTSHKNISGQSDGTLRGRIGARLAWNGDNGKHHTNTFYVSAHLLHDFTGYKSKAKISSHGITDSLTERYGKTWGELQIGTQIATSKSSYLYGNVSYERSLGGNKNDVYRGNKRAREGVKGYIGVRFNF